MLKKYLLMALSMFAFRGQPHSEDPADRMADFIKKNIRAEISAMGFRLLTGVVLAAIIIYSVIELGQALQVYAMQFQNGIILEIAGFGLATLACATAFYLIFRSNIALKKSVEVDESVKPSPVSLDIVSLTENFLDGFLVGLMSPKMKQQAPRYEGYDQSPTN